MSLGETTVGLGRPAGDATRRGRGLWKGIGALLGRQMPKGLYARALLIVILPVLVLQSVLTFVFLDRHTQTVTERLSAGLSKEVAALIAVLESYPQDAGYDTLTRIARRDLNLIVSMLPLEPLPPPAPRSFFSVLDRALPEAMAEHVKRPFWIDTSSLPDFIDIRVQLADRILRVLARRGQASASNPHIFLIWMVGTSLALLAVAVLFLRNQIRPILQLAEAAEDFGRGRPPPADFRPRGAREVRKAAEAFQEMRGRIERQIEQRTTMLAGVSHDLRTILTRFKLQLALLPESPEIEALARDVDEMQAMLEGYLAFARGDGDEQAHPIDVPALLKGIEAEAALAGFTVPTRFSGEPTATLKPNAFKRLAANLVLNACRHGERVEVTAAHAGGWLTVIVDDDGPGIPPAERENVFRPFYRLDKARNQDEGGTGLGLAIARDIAHGHGGDVALETSPLGGLRAVVRVPG